MGKIIKIKFTNTMGVPEEYSPKPASKYIPDWYRDIESYMGGKKKTLGDGTITATIKRCMPVFDAIVGGYIITTYTDVYVSQKDVEYVDGPHLRKTGKNKKISEAKRLKENLPKTAPHYEWSSFSPLEWHPVEQAPNHPNKGNLPTVSSYPKWINPWAITTPPGYSVLFTAPMHRESVFTILDGIVDTDTYSAPVNFPFVLNDWGFEGLIPAGTPIAQVIPFKRDSWEMEIGGQEEFVNQNKVTTLLRTKFFDSYKNQYRQHKEYK
jgi:hypothetical protein